MRIQILRRFIEKDTTPVQFIPLTRSSNALLPQELCDLISIDVIHDGVYIPPSYLETYRGFRLTKKEFNNALLSRETGVQILWQKRYQSISLVRFYNCQNSLMSLDFWKIPGGRPEMVLHTSEDLQSIPFAQWLDYDQKRSLLEDHYDVISNQMEEQLRGKLLKIAIHTYDPYNDSGTERPMYHL